MKHFLLTMSALSCLALSTHIAAAQEDPYPAPSLTSLTSSDRPDAWKIKNALTAGPKFITDHAAVMDWPSAEDKDHKMRVLREGSNRWTCMPDRPGKPRHNPMCADQTMMKWMMAIMAGAKPNIDRIGISYMLQGVGPEIDARELPR